MKKTIIVLMFAICGMLDIMAQSGYVGQTISLRGPSVSGTIGNASWGSSNTSYVSVSGNAYNATARILQYFSGTVTITCRYAYTYYVGTKKQHGSGSATYSISCISSTVTINRQTLTLDIGEEATLRYSNSSGYTLPCPYWSTSSNIVSINGTTQGWSGEQTATVKALKEGECTITFKGNCGSSPATCKVTVKKAIPTSVVISPSQSVVYCDEGLQLKASVLPSNASQYVSWSMTKGNTSIATLSGNGYITGVSPGQIEVKATAENGVSATKSISIAEPSFIFDSSSPVNNESNTSVFINPSVTFSHNIYSGDKLSSVKLMNSDNNKNVEGSLRMNGKTISFIPSKALLPQTNYCFVIPGNAVKNKWGTPYSSTLNIRFKTGEYEKLTLATSNTNRFLQKGDVISLTASQSDATIYYTTDGTAPTAKSNEYRGTLIFERDIKLRAIAMGDGYASSDVLSRDYYLSNVEVLEYYPNSNTALYLYNDVNPYIRFSNQIEQGDNINDIAFVKNSTEQIPGEIIVADSSIFFVPTKPFELGCSYTFHVPNQAIVTKEGEPNKDVSWTFGTGDYVTKISNGHKLAAAIKTDGSLLTWGELYQTGNSTNGSYINKKQESPLVFVDSEVLDVSAGYMHNAIIKQDGSLWMWGRQYCGEMGNNSTTGSAIPLKVMENVKSVSCGGQTTAIVKNDGTLWMAGRNDFGQIGDGSDTVCPLPVMVMADVQSATAGWCTSFAVNNSGALFAWGLNDKGQLGDGTNENKTRPVMVLTDVAIVETSSTESSYTAAIKTDGSLWIWGYNNAPSTKIADNVCSVAVHGAKAEYVTTDGSLYNFSNGVSTKINNGVADVASSGNSILLLKNDGSVWTASGTQQTGRIINGRTPSDLTGLYFNRKTLIMQVGTMNVIAHRPLAINADYSTMKWDSSNEDVVTVSERGVVAANSIGSSTVTATISDNIGKSYKATCNISVVEEVSKIHIPLAETNNVRIWARDNKLFMSGMTIGETVSIYSNNGQLIDCFVADAADISKYLQIKGVIIIKTMDTTLKILVK